MLHGCSERQTGGAGLEGENWSMPEWSVVGMATNSWGSTSSV